MEDCVFVRRSCPPEADWPDSADLPASGGLVRLWRDRLIGFCGKSRMLATAQRSSGMSICGYGNYGSNMNNETYGKKT